MGLYYLEHNKLRKVALSFVGIMDLVGEKNSRADVWNDFKHQRLYIRCDVKPDDSLVDGLVWQEENNGTLKNGTLGRDIDKLATNH